MYIIIALMLGGIILGYFLRGIKHVRHVDRIISVLIFVLVFTLGVSIGTNKLLVNNIGFFSVQAAVIAVFSIAGSLLCSTIISKTILKDKNKQENER
jgi:uncharacterized membrane protein YbjE (DUF340 family)